MINEEELKQEELELRQKQLEVERLNFEKQEAEAKLEEEKQEKIRLENIKRAKSESNWIKFIGIAVVIFIISIVVKCSSSSDVEDKPDNVARSIMYTEQYIKELLKSPSTADFGYSDVEKISYNKYHVSNYVDSQNSFGATIRMKYECDIKWDGDNYVISNVEME